VIFLNCDNTEMKRSSKIIFYVPERHRWAVEGQLICWAEGMSFFGRCSANFQVNILFDLCSILFVAKPSKLKHETFR